jgi:hypothetical protein
MALAAEDLVRGKIVEYYFEIITDHDDDMKSFLRS